LDTGLEIVEGGVAIELGIFAPPALLALFQYELMFLVLCKPGTQPGLIFRRGGAFQRSFD
jgi:hypothetical protein